MSMVGYKRKRIPMGPAWAGAGLGAGMAARRIQRWYRNTGAKRARLGNAGGASWSVPQSQNILNAFSQRVRASVGSMLGNPTRRGREQQEGANSITKCHFGTMKSTLPLAVYQNLQPQFFASNYAEKKTTTAGIQDFAEYAYLESGTLNTLLPSKQSAIYISKLDAELSMVNSSESNSQLMIYDIICRKDCASATFNSTPGVAWSYGIDEEGGSSTSYQTVGALPTDSQNFNVFFKIIQKTPISLAPGQLHRHCVTFNPNKKIQGFQSNAQVYGLAGLTCFTMVVHHGMPAHDSTTLTAVTIDPSYLDIVRKSSVTYKILERYDTQFTRSNTLATSFAVGEQFVNEAVGQTVDTAGLHPGTLHS